jgi:two-component system sensor histidine kinase AgrC
MTLGIYSLIASKFYKARKADVFFDVHITAKISQIGVSTYILSRVLGVLLDNAIEAASDSFEKSVSLEIVNVFDSVQIIVQNSYVDKEINVDKIFEKGFSSKTKNSNSHGLGLWKVKEMISLHTNLALKASKNFHYFRQVLEIGNESK